MRIGSSPGGSRSRVPVAPRAEHDVPAGRDRQGIANLRYTRAASSEQKREPAAADWVGV